MDQEMLERCKPGRGNIPIALDIPLGIEEPDQRKGFRGGWLLCGRINGAR